MASSSASPKTCKICKKDDKGTCLVTDRGLASITKACNKKQCSDLLNLFTANLSSNNPSYVHNSCRRKLTDLRSLKRSDHASTPYKIPKRLRSKSNESQFSWTTCCFFCRRDVGHVRNTKKFLK